MVGKTSSNQAAETAMTKQQDDMSDERVLACTSARWGLLVLGFTSVGLGIAGAFLPVMPSTVFFLIALWAFSKSSLRAHRWLFNHPKYGPTLQAWHEHKVIPFKAKLLATVMITGSFAYVTIFVATTWMLPVILGAVLSAVLLFILTRPHNLSDIA